MTDSPFLGKLLAAAARSESLVCVGLDVDPQHIPASVRQQHDTVVGQVAAFNRAIVEATADLVCAYKPNLAFYEALGCQGWEALALTLAAIPKEVPVIADAKRADVGHTGEAYARALFDVWSFDAATVNPYLGQDALRPFLERADKGVLVLCKTSNPGSAEFQDLYAMAKGVAGPRPLYEIVARRVVEWNQRGNCGLVVGATYPEQLRRIRAIAPELPILIPGVGAQAGDLEQAVRSGVDVHGQRAIINSSRGVLYASSGPDFAEAARRAVIELRDAINSFRAASFDERAT